MRRRRTRLRLPGSRPGAAPRPPRPRSPARPGFTLIETALTTVIVGVGVLALIDAQQGFMRSNEWSTHAATATYLANELREMTRKFPKHDPVTGLWLQVQGNTAVLRGWGPDAGESELTDFDDVDDFDGLTLSGSGDADPADGDLPGPVDAFGNVIPEISSDGSVPVDAEGAPLPLLGWSQTITVQKLDPYDSGLVRPHSYSLPAQAPSFPGLAVDKFPLRVTVTVSYQGRLEDTATDIATIVWIVP